jgi:hypothetical protein
MIRQRGKLARFRVHKESQARPCVRAPGGMVFDQLLIHEKALEKHGV